MNKVTPSKMKQMKLYGMHEAFKTAIETGKTDDYTIDQFTSMMIDAEFDDRNNRSHRIELMGKSIGRKRNILDSKDV